MESGSEGTSDDLGWQDGQVVLNRYRLESLLGKGSHGTVWRGIDLIEDRRVCLKALHLLDPGTATLLTSEFVMLSGLEHPNLEAVYDLYSSENHRGTFFTCEYIDGKNIYKATEGLALEEILSHIVSLVQALQFLHRNGLVHLDVKPQNVLFGEHGVKLIDFGLARPITRLSDGVMRGTPLYMAPEVIQGFAVDHRADLYSLGVTMYHLLERRPPFAAELGRAILRAHVEQTAPALSDRAGGLPPVIRRTVDRLMAKDPADRYKSTGEVLDELASAGIEVAQPRAARSAYVRSSDVIGRDKELELLDRTLTGVPRGCDRPFVLVSGEAGIGKSRLLKELRIRAQTRGFGCFAGTAYSGAGVSLEAIRDVLWKCWTYVTSRLDDQAGLEKRWRERYSGALSAVLPDQKPTDIQSYAEIYDGLASWLVEASRVSPLVILLEDLHWADDGTAALLTRLADQLCRAADRGKLLIVGSYRPDGLQQTAMARTLERLRAREQNMLIKLSPLDLDNTSRLVESMLGIHPVPDEFCQRLHSLSMGNPLFLEQTLGGLLEEKEALTPGQLTAREVLSLPVPAKISEILKRRIATQPRTCRAILQVMSVWNRPVAISYIARVCQLQPIQIAKSLHQLIGKRLVVRRLEAEVERFELVHTHLQKSLHEGLHSTRRKTLHSRIADVLIALRAGERNVWPELASHLVKAQRGKEALHYGIGAIEDLTRAFSLDQALALCKLLLQATERTSPARARILIQMAEIYEFLCRPAEYRKTADAAMALLPRGSEQRTAFLVHMASYERKRGDLPRLSQLLDEIDEDQVARNGRLYETYLAAPMARSVNRGELDEVARLFREADEKLSPHGIRASESTALRTIYGIALASHGKFRHPDCQHILRPASVDTSQNRYYGSRLSTIQAHLCWRMGQLPEAIAALRMAEKDVESNPWMTASVTQYHAVHGDIELWSGNTLAAGTAYDKALAAANSADHNRARCIAACSRHSVLIAEGKLRLAESETGRMLRLTERKQIRYLTPMAAIAHAEVLHAQGRLKRALRVLESGLAIASEMDERWYGRLGEAAYARLLAAMGRAEEALVIGHRLAADCADHDDYVALWHARAAIVTAQVTAGEPDAGIRAVELWKEAHARGAVHIAHKLAEWAVRAAVKLGHFVAPGVVADLQSVWNRARRQQLRLLCWRIGCLLAHVVLRKSADRGAARAIWGASVRSLDNLRPDVDQKTYRRFAREATVAARAVLRDALPASAAAVLDGRDSEPVPVADLASVLNGFASKGHTVPAELLAPRPPLEEGRGPLVCSILDQMLTATRSDRGVLFLRPPGAREDAFELAAAYGVDEIEFAERPAVQAIMYEAARMKRLVFLSVDGPAGKALARERHREELLVAVPLLASEREQSRRKSRSYQTDAGATASLPKAMPSLDSLALYGHGAVGIAVLKRSLDKGTLPPETRMSIEDIAVRCALCIVESYVLQVSTRDEASGLRNRDHIQRLCRAEIRTAKRRGNPLSVVLVEFATELDGEWLVQLGRSLPDVVKPTGRVGRWGARELVVLLPGRSRQDAEVVIPRLASCLQDIPGAGDGARCGVAEYPAHGETVEDLARHASETLAAMPEGPS